MKKKYPFCQTECSWLAFKWERRPGASRWARRPLTWLQPGPCVDLILVSRCSVLTGSLERAVPRDGGIEHFHIKISPHLLSTFEWHRGVRFWYDRKLWHARVRQDPRGPMQRETRTEEVEPQVERGLWKEEADVIGWETGSGIEKLENPVKKLVFVSALDRPGEKMCGTRASVD